MNPQFQHYCYEWDEALIDETYEEFATCLCYRGNPEAEKHYKEWSTKLWPEETTVMNPKEMK